MIIFIIFLLLFPIEITIKTKLHVHFGYSSIFINSDIAYKIKHDDKIILHILDKYYSSSIEQIIYDKKLHLFEVKLVHLQIELIPDTTINAIIINGNNSLISFLISGV